ncbi:hypothetical protein CEP54_006290 [Fusarium duplospermum]|uniref:Uncharacterized protein n=1 Tax=Fusarium duplospermum TaxID=1325734 RepID=A0A428Q7K4_9HYPO|nr:hypothetical protein CEP54_006290 [Fusarium duplospermum]
MAYSPNRKSPSSRSSFSSNPILAGSFVNPVNGIVFAPVVHLCFLQSPSFGSSASLFQLISVQSFTPPNLPYQTRPTPPTTSLSEVPSPGIHQPTIGDILSLAL